MPDELHISSLIVLAHREQADAIARAIDALPGAEVQLREAQRLVVTLETASQSEIVTLLNEIGLLPGVLSTALVYHQWLPVDQEAEKCSQPAAT